MLVELSARAVREWVAYFNREMWPDVREDARAALIAFHVYHSAPRRTTRPFSYFMLDTQSQRENRVQSFKQRLMQRARRVS